MIAEPHLGLGAILPLEGDLAGDRIDLQRARALQPTNPAILFQSGLLDFHAGRLDAAYASWKVSLTLSDEFLPRILWRTAESLGDLETVRRLLPDRPRWLIGLTRDQLASDDYEKPRSAVTQRALELLDQGDLPEDETCYLRALALENRKEYGEAIKSFDRAVRLRPMDTAWREEYAKLLEGQGMIGDAIEQVVVLARMYPDNLRIQTWLMNLHLTSLRQRASGG